MKHFFCTSIIIALLTLTTQAQTNSFPATGSVGIGTTSPDASAVLEIKSTNKGLLTPRLTIAQRNAITAPATGLLIYQTNSTPGFYYYTGSNWTPVKPKQNSWSLTGNDATIPGTNFIGTTDYQPLLIKVNNWKAGYLDNNLSGNVSFGTRALINITSGSYNLAVGLQSLELTNTGSSNVAIGNSTMYGNISGSNNVALGNTTLRNNNIGSNNVAVGTITLNSNTSGSYNTAIGNFASANISGYGNTSVGAYSSQASTTGSYNTAIGYDAGILPFSGSNFDNNTTLGYAAYGTANNQVRIGNGDVTSIGGYVNWSNISDGRYKQNMKNNVKGLDFINKLKPITYNLDITGIEDKFTVNSKKNKSANVVAPSLKQTEARRIKESIVYSGFVAQDVEKAAKELNYDFSGIDAPKNENDLYGLRYADFVVPLVKAVQELSASNDTKGKQIELLQQQINELKTLISTISSSQSADTKTNVALNEIVLEQNIPNPFSGSTTIKYQLPIKYKEAKLIVTSNDGKIVKQVNIGKQNKGTMVIDAGLLTSGVYHYTLYIDNKIAGSKSMIIQ